MGCIPAPRPVFEFNVEPRADVMASAPPQPGYGHLVRLSAMRDELGTAMVSESEVLIQRLIHRLLGLPPENRYNGAGITAEEASIIDQGNLMEHLTYVGIEVFPMEQDDYGNVGSWGIRYANRDEINKSLSQRLKKVRASESERSSTVGASIGMTAIGVASSGAAAAAMESTSETPQPPQDQPKAEERPLAPG